MSYLGGGIRRPTVKYVPIIVEDVGRFLIGRGDRHELKHVVVALGRDVEGAFATVGIRSWKRLVHLGLKCSSALRLQWWLWWDTLLVDHAVQPSRPILGLPYLLTVA